jgi:hypothetical protein
VSRITLGMRKNVGNVLEDDGTTSLAKFCMTTSAMDECRL